MESLLKINKKGICYERDAESKDNFEKISAFCNELKTTITEIKKSFYSKYDMCVSK